MPQTAKNTICIAPPTDARVIKLFSDLIEQSSDHSASFSVAVGEATLGNFKDEAGVRDKLEGIDLDHTKLITNLQFGIQISNSHLIVTFNRSASEINVNGHAVHTPSQYQNELAAFSANQHPIPLEVYLPIWRKISEFSTDYQPEVAITTDTKAPWAGALGGHIAQIASLQTRLLEDSEKARLEAADERLQLLERTETEIRNLKADAQAKIDFERAAVDAERAALDARSADLDDRLHMHARREMREDITSDLKSRLERPAVSAEIWRARSMVLLAGGLGIFALSGLTAYASFDLHQAFTSPVGNNALALIISATRVGLPAAAAIGLLAWLLNYQRQIAADDARVERDLERYRYDLDRASWTIETVLEIQGQEGHSIPEQWISGVTHNLFSSSETRGEGTNALEALGSLLNFSGKLELGPAGPKLELNKGGLKRLSKSALSEADD